MKMETRKLEDIFLFIRNGVSIQQKGETGIPITRIETISNSKIDEMRLGYADIVDDKYEDYYLREGDILMSHINSQSHLGKCALVPTPNRKIIHGMNLLMLRPNKLEVNPAFCAYYFNSSSFKKNIHRISNQSVNQSSFSVSKLRELPIELPPLVLQQKIAQILSEADKARQLRKQANALTDQFLQSTFLSMFGDPVSNPKGWKTETILDSGSKVQIGPFGAQLHVEDYVEGGIPLINPTHIQSSKIKEDKNFTITPQKFSELSNYHLSEGDIIMGRRGKWEDVH